MRRRLLSFLLFLFAAQGLSAQYNPNYHGGRPSGNVIWSTSHPSRVPRNSNRLTDEEKADGWVLLFDGQTLNGWHSYNKTGLDGNWEAKDGAIHLADKNKNDWVNCRDLVSDGVYGDFDLKAQWMVAPQTNSGLLFHVQEGPYQWPYQTGLEMEIVDNKSFPAGGHSGSLPGMIPCNPDNAKKYFDWNDIEIICQNGVLTFIQNGQTVVKTSLYDDAWKNRVAASPFNNTPSFGIFHTGKIDLQDYRGNEVWFTNMKIKRLDATSSGDAAGTPGTSTGKAAVAATGTTAGMPPGNSNDLSGVWEGQQINDGLLMYYQLALVKTGEHTYSGFDSCRWVQNNSNGQVPHAKKVFVATFDGNILTCTELGNMQNSNWVNGPEYLKLVNNNGTEQLVNGNTSQPARSFDLHRSGQAFPKEYLPYLVYDSSLRIDGTAYTNAHGQSTLRYNDQGQVTVSIHSNASMTLTGLTASIQTEETDNGILGYEKLKGRTVDVAPGSPTQLSFPIATNFSVPDAPLHVTIVLKSGDKLFAQSKLTIRTDPFYKTTQVSLPENGNVRIKMLSHYYGAADTASYAPLTGFLANPALADDKLVRMWKAVFMFKGSAGFKLDEGQSVALAKQSLDLVESRARKGDEETLYLMSYACQMGLEGPASAFYAESFLQRSAQASFGPAVYDEGLLALRRKNYDKAFADLIRCYQMGMKKAASNIGSMYEGGNYVDKNVDSAVAWYQKGIAFRDPAAMTDLALLYAAGFGDTPPDVNKTLELLARASNQNYTPAMMIAGNIYLNGKQGKPQNVPTAIKWFKRAADLGDADGMLHLGIAYLSDNVPGVVKDEASGFFWIKKSAEQGSPTGMKALSRMYDEGLATNKDVIRARYWYNQAVQLGAAQMERKDLEQNQQDMTNFWQNADFSPSYVYLRDNQVVGDSGPDFFGGMIGGFIGSFMDRYAHPQEEISGLEFIQQKNGYKIYGGTVSSPFASSLVLKKGQTVTIRAYGIISTGMMSGSANADGLGNAWAEYRIVPDIPCSAVMGQVQDASWQFIGQSATYTAPKDGPLCFALNGKDYRNYKGYFDLVVKLPVE